MNSNFYALLLVALFFTACDKGGLQKSPLASSSDLYSLVISDEIDGKDNKGKEGKEHCFELIYPLTIAMPDGTEYTDTEKALWALIKAWYEANPNTKEKPNLNYPISILWKDEIAKTIENETEMETAKKYCYDKDGKADCFDLIYPVSWSMPDNATIMMNDPKDWDEVKLWYENNPTSKEKPSLNYPVDIVFKDGATKSVKDDSEMAILKKECD